MVEGKIKGVSKIVIELNTRFDDSVADTTSVREEMIRSLHDTIHKKVVEFLEDEDFSREVLDSMKNDDVLVSSVDSFSDLGSVTISVEENNVVLENVGGLNDE